MWRLLIFLLFLIGSVWAGLEIIRHPGYLFIIYQSWIVQMPLWFALISFIVALIIFYLLINSIDQLRWIGFRLKNWLRFRRANRSYSKTQDGLTMLIESRWKKAERLLLAGINQATDPLINYLGLAKAAHEQKDFDNRDRYIKKAYQLAPEASLAIGLVQADLEIAQGNFEQAIATLSCLQQKMPLQPRMLKLLEKIYVHLADWKNLQTLLPSLRKAKLITTEQAELFEKNIYCELLRSHLNKNLDDIQSLWNDIPRSIKKNPEVVYEYVKQLLHYANTTEVEALIRKTLKYHWHAELVKIYGTLPYSQLNRQLVIVSAWVKTYGQHPELLLTLGRLCVRLQLWGKAKDYFEKCLALGHNPEASYDYGMLLEQLGEPEAAMKQYRKGLKSSQHSSI